MQPEQIVSAEEALRRLEEGNRRFALNVHSKDSIASKATRQDLATANQRPFAIVLCCSDSRAPAELIFDQGLGDLFVVRVAGNIVAPSLVGSIEFAASMFGTQLVVVMGHTNCGAVAATLEAATRERWAPSENIHDIIERILPQVESLAHLNLPREQLMHEATRANVRASVSQLKHGSRILEVLVRQKKLQIIGAEYNLETGIIEFLDGIDGK